MEIQKTITKLNLKANAKSPVNVAFHARRQAALRGMSVDRLSDLERSAWRQSSGISSGLPPRWVLRDARTRETRGYYYTLPGVLQAFGLTI